MWDPEPTFVCLAEMSVAGHPSRLQSCLSGSTNYIMLSVILASSSHRLGIDEGTQKRRDTWSKEAFKDLRILPEPLFSLFFLKMTNPSCVSFVCGQQWPAENSRSLAWLFFIIRVLGSTSPVVFLFLSTEDHLVPIS